MDVEQMMQDNMGLVFFNMRKHGILPNNDDAYSLALEALWKAAKTFDDSKGYKFATYASVCIYNACGMYLRKQRQDARYGWCSLDDEVCEGVTFSEMVPDTHTPESIMSEDCGIALINAALDKVIAGTTSARARQALELWRESDFTANQAELGAMVGMSQSCVSRALSAARHKIKKELEGQL